MATAAARKFDPIQKPQAAAVYTRISRDSEQQGLGVARQEKECREWAARRGWTIGKVYSDNDISAFSGKRRKGYQAMLDAVKSGEVDGIVAWANDRLQRNLKELDEFIDLVNEAGIAVGVVTGGEYDLTTSEGRLLARIVGATARAESERKSERSRANHRQLRESGMPAGGSRPFGFSEDRRSLNKKEAARIRQAAEDLLVGRPVAVILREWNESGLKTTTGRNWVPQSFRKMMVSDRLAGKRDLDGKKVQAVWPAVLDEVTAKRIQALFSNRKTGPALTTTHAKHLLSGIAQCGLCRTALVSQPVPDPHGGPSKPAYVCSKNVRGCGKLRIRAADLEEDLLGRLWARINPVSLKRQPSQHPDDAEALEAMQRLQNAAMHLAEMLGNGELSPTEFRAAKAANEKALAEASRRVADIATKTMQVAALSEATNLEDRWPSLSIEDQRRFIRALFTNIAIGPAVRGRSFYDPDRLTVEFAF